ncbi:MAG: LETM1 domain-containing protein, partial [Bacteroidota bacterium]|nr:LETM1 domain-containing protein [Bacteroidota bacterium]
AIKNANNDVNNFYKKYKNEISLLSNQNIAERFYRRTSSIVKKLISRNSKRLYQELKESKDLVKLVSESTVRDLNKEEQQQMQEQMMDLIKSIPSLAIFMLPGGAILLPIFIKFIPKLLPSAFDENRIEND